jgi:hypothetical protein
MESLTETTHHDMHAPDGRRVLHLRVDRHHDHTAITVVTPFDTTLDRAMPDAEADAYLAFLATEVESGTRLWMLEQRAGAWTSAMAVADQAEQDLIDAVNATLDQAAADLTAHHAAEQARVADIVNGPRNGWNALRQAHTRTGKPTSEPMDRILNTARDGYIPRGQDATSVQLIALHKRGKVVLDWQTRNGRRRIAGAWIAGQQPTEVAA